MPCLLGKSKGNINIDANDIKKKNIIIGITGNV